MSKTRIKKNLLAIPTRALAEAAMNELAHAENKRRQHIADRDEIILSVTEDWADRIAACDDRVKELRDGLETWANQNPHEFGKKKSIEMSAGTLGFRTGTPKLKLLSGWTWEKVLAALQTVGMSGFIRIKREVDKDAIIGDSAAIPSNAQRFTSYGVKVVQDESFYVEPNLTDLEVQS